MLPLTRPFSSALFSLLYTISQGPGTVLTERPHLARNGPNALKHFLSPHFNKNLLGTDLGMNMRYPSMHFTPTSGDGGQL